MSTPLVSENKPAGTGFGRPFFQRWTLVVLACGILGGVLFGLTALLATRFAPEYLFIVWHLPYENLVMHPWDVFFCQAWEGLRFGCFAGALLAAMWTTRGAGWPAAWRLGREVAIISGLSVLVGSAAALFCYGSARKFGSFLPLHLAEQIGSPFRVLAFLGFQYGAASAALVAVVWRGCRCGWTENDSA